MALFVALSGLLSVQALRVYPWTRQLQGPGGYDVQGLFDVDGEMPATMSLSSWTAVVNSAQVPAEFKPRLLVLERGEWMVSVPLWSARAETGDFDGCPPAPRGVQKEVLLMSLTAGGKLCFSGTGFQTRAASTCAMIQEAANVLRKRGRFPRPFGPKTIGIGDDTPCSFDFGYSTQSRGPCQVVLIPDFTFWKWPEAGLLPNFTVLTHTLERIGQKPAEEQVCGWIGSPVTHHTLLPAFERKVRKSSSFVVKYGQPRISAENQTRLWACLVDIPSCLGYSGRVPMLLHSGRPVIMLERIDPSSAEPTGYFTDNTWYAQFMRAWVHYIPLRADFSNLHHVTRVALGKEGQKIARKAMRMAKSNLTTERAVSAMADILLAVKDEEIDS